MIKEFCAENFTDIPRAIAAGATRIELCDNLAVGGTTPSSAVMTASVAYAHAHDVPVFAMIRPRGGNFVYQPIEIEMMVRDIETAIAAGVDGVVLGALTADNWLNEAALAKLLAAAKGVAVTFHMAFDEIPVARQHEAIDVLHELGVARILTHGGDLTTGIAANYAHLANLVQHAQNKLVVLVGGGVNFDNYADVMRATGAVEVHGTKIVAL